MPPILISRLMSRYNEQYAVETDLFGAPYPEFVDFVQRIDLSGRALDLGCGQGRDALMLAAQGFCVTAVDVSQVGVSQMIERAKARELDVTGFVEDIYEFDFPETYELIVLDSILHFAEDCDEELALLDRVRGHTKAGGYVVMFVHKSRRKERHLRRYIETLGESWEEVENRYIDYVYEERQSNFRSSFQFNMVVLQRTRGSKLASGKAA